MESWPVKGINADVAKFCRLMVEHMADQQKMQADKKLPNVLMHDSTGLKSCISVAACYIGRQMWAKDGVLNPSVILNVSF